MDNDHQPDRPPATRSTRAYYDAVHAATVPTLAFRATTPEEVATWRNDLTAKLRDLLGGFPSERVAIDVRVLARQEEEHYVRETVEFSSEPGVNVPAYLLRPKRPLGDGRAPAVLCLHGHGRGKDDVVGLAASPRERQRRVRALRYDYGHHLAERGYVVLAPDARGFGARVADGMDCTWAMTAGLLLGKILVGLRVWDAFRAIDYLLALPDVDPDRIGCVGLSWGGTHTMYTAALDDRVRVAVVSGAFGSFKDQLIDAPECPCQYVPNILRWADLADIVALIAPRPVLISVGNDDQHATREVVAAEYRTVESAYRVLGAADRVALDRFDGGHRFDLDPAVAWLARWL